MNNKITLIVKDEKMRIDAYLARELSDFSRSAIKKSIIEQKVLVNGKSVKPKYIVQLNDEIIVIQENVQDTNIRAEKIPLNIVYEDDAILIINKQKGLVVHPAPGHYSHTLVNGLMHYCNEQLSDINGLIRPGIVHRIDKDTTGLLVVAKTNSAHNFLAKLFKTHDIIREYTALSYGMINEKGGTINAPIGRDPKFRKKMAVNLANGKRAFTTFEVLIRYRGYTLIRATLETGRTHQIRVHMKYIKHPLVGDELYTNKKDSFGVKGQMLHANKLGFIHPITKKYIEFTADIPKEFQSILQGLELYE
ncbi:MAG: RluA family pseudouridine synthase [Clostridiales bacterium]|nr:RluA family pseudouridine synthase [Clostridiales bacterium]